MPGPEASNQKTQQRGSEAGRTQRTYREGRRAPSLLSGLGRRQSRAHLGARASPRIPSHLSERREGSGSARGEPSTGCTSSSPFEMSSLASADASTGPGTASGKLSPKARRAMRRPQGPRPDRPLHGAQGSPRLLPASVVTVRQAVWGKAGMWGLGEIRCIFIFSSVSPSALFWCLR